MLGSHSLLAVRVVCLGLLVSFLAACGTSPSGNVPAAPAEFGITGISAFCMDNATAGVLLGWAASEGAATFEVTRDSAKVAALVGTETSFTDVTGLTPGATVEYVVSAGNPGGTTVTEPESFLIPASVCTTESPVPPGPTGELAA